VVSVGNLTMGGTGKTPMVHYLARMLQQHGFKPAIISRGYGGTAGKPVNIVSDGATLLLDAKAAGDEPRLLAETLPGIPVLTGVVRRLPAQRAVDMGADVLILDDGFQHLPVRRDVNLVLFSTDRLAGNSRVFPGGELREPVAALQRATGFVMTGVNEGNRERAHRFGDLLQAKFSGIPVYYAGYRVATLVSVQSSGAIVPMGSEEMGKKGFGFCGIAHPASFQIAVSEHGLELVGFRAFADHQRYSDATVNRLVREAQSAGADFLLTTEKDMVKLSHLAECLPFPLYGLRMQVESDARLSEYILQAIRSRIKTA
jgi:tetraacyldisaccharide 4'-kinase